MYPQLQYKSPAFRPSLGLVASSRRSIKPGWEYNQYFKKPEGTDPLLSKDASVYDTLDLIKSVVAKCHPQCAAIAKVLRGSTVKQSCKNIWDFLYNHIQYKLDKENEEQLRSPNRSWADRRSGIDCDCFAIFASCILTQMSIDHSLRMCEIKGKGYFQHIYVVVNDGNNN